MTEHKNDAGELALLDLYRRLAARDQHKLMLAAKAMLAAADDKRRRGL